MDIFQYFGHNSKNTQLQIETKKSSLPLDVLYRLILKKQGVRFSGFHAAPPPQIACLNRATNLIFQWKIKINDIYHNKAPINFFIC